MLVEKEERDSSQRCTVKGKEAANHKALHLLGKGEKFLLVNMVQHWKGLCKEVGFSKDRLGPNST